MRHWVSSLTGKILIGMALGLIVGSLINALAPENDFLATYITGGLFHILGSMFIESLKMLVVPLVFCSLLTGVMGMNDLKALGRTGGKTFALYLLTTAIAITIALVLAVSSGIGQGFELNPEQAATFTAKEAPSFSEVMIGIVPSNIIGAMAEGNMLQVIFACIVLGIAMVHSGYSGQRMGEWVARGNDIMMTVVNMVMAAAPYGVFCLMARTFAQEGLEVILPMSGYFGVLLAALLLHALFTYSGLLVVAGLNPFRFLRKMRSVQLFAFSTSSSNATIPVNLRAAEERLGVDNGIASFTIPLGATINMDGTAIMQGVATVFIANAYGIDLTMMDYLTVIGMSVLASIGTAGVPGVGLIMLAMVFAQVGLPVEGIALIIGVDRLLDMARTAVNVTGDAAVTCVVAKSEGQLDVALFNNLKAGVPSGKWDEDSYGNHEKEPSESALLSES